MAQIDPDDLTAAILPAVLEAARVEMGYFAAGVAVEAKADKSPVTIADREAEKIILAALARFAPAIPTIAEEAFNDGIVPEIGNRFFLVDALDGTSGFVKAKPEFTINIGLVADQKPVYGLIYVPPTGDLYVTRNVGGTHKSVISAKATSAEMTSAVYKPVRSRAYDRANIIAFNSRTAGGAAADFLARLVVKDNNPMGSSRKFCLIAEGEGDVYVRYGRTCEWDTAAGQAILEGAGGTVVARDGLPLRYGKTASSYQNPHFVAWGREPLMMDEPALQTRLPSAGA